MSLNRGSIKLMPRKASSRAGPQALPTDSEAARAVAIACLARRDFASSELRQELGARGFDGATAAAAVAALVGEGLLSDTRYAHHFVAMRAGRGQGPARIAAELRRHGIDEALVAAALAAGPDWRALALRVRRAKYGPQPPASWQEKARQARFLQYRGFSSDDIRAATDVDVEQD
jgi:regulatory protein